MEGEEMTNETKKSKKILEKIREMWDELKVKLEKDTGTSLTDEEYDREMLDEIERHFY